MTSLSGSAVCWGLLTGTSVGNARFELFVLLLTVAGVALLGVTVLVITLAAGVAPAPDSGAVHLAPPVGMGGKNYGLSW